VCVRVCVRACACVCVCVCARVCARAGYDRMIKGREQVTQAEKPAPHIHQGQGVEFGMGTVTLHHTKKNV